MKSYLPYLRDGRQNDDEKQEVEMLLLPVSDAEDLDNLDELSEYLMKNNKRPKRESSSKYQNLAFILGSVAEAERLWSSGKKPYSPERAKPQTI